MSTHVVVRDEHPSGNALDECRLELPIERVTVRELIRSRIYQEVQNFNRGTASDDERALARRLPVGNSIKAQPT